MTASKHSYTKSEPDCFPFLSIGLGLTNIQEHRLSSREREAHPSSDPAADRVRRDYTLRRPDSANRKGSGLCVSSLYSSSSHTSYTCCRLHTKLPDSRSFEASRSSEDWKERVAVPFSQFLGSCYSTPYSIFLFGAGITCFGRLDEETRKRFTLPSSQNPAPLAGLPPNGSGAGSSTAQAAGTLSAQQDAVETLTIGEPTKNLRRKRPPKKGRKNLSGGTRLLTIFSTNLVNRGGYRTDDNHQGDRPL